MPDYYAMNSTVASMDVVNSVSGGAMLWLAVMVIAAVVMIALISSLERYTKFWAALEWLLHSVKFTAYGAGISGALYGIYLACEMIAAFGSGINPIYIAYGIGGYVGLTALGWGATKVYARLKDLHTQYQTHKQGELTA